MKVLDLLTASQACRRQLKVQTGGQPEQLSVKLVGVADPFFRERYKTTYSITMVNLVDSSQSVTKGAEAGHHARSMTSLQDTNGL